jgi:hypothetical protein
VIGAAATPEPNPWQNVPIPRDDAEAARRSTVMVTASREFHAQAARAQFRATHFGGALRLDDDDLVDARRTARRALSVTKPKSFARRVLERLRPFLPPAWIGFAAGVCVAVALILLVTSCASDDGDVVVLGADCSTCSSDVDCAQGLHCDRGTWTCRTPQQVNAIACDSDCLLPTVFLPEGKTSSMCEAFGRCRAFAGECWS